MSLLTDFEIENFRCFDTFKMHNIKRINLIGGMNNAGKTALLEALFLLDGIDRYSIEAIYKEIRASKLTDSSQGTASDWQPLFYKGRTDELIKLKSTYSSARTKNVYIRTFDASHVQKFSDVNMSEQTLETKVAKLSAGAFLYEGTYIDNKTTPSLRFNWAYRPIPSSNTPAATNQRYSATDLVMLSGLRFVYFITDTDSRKGADLVGSYDELKRGGYANKLLSAFQLIEPTIESVEILNLKNPAIYLMRKGEHIPLALSCFGDAMVKIATYTTTLINNPNSVVLLDEIENCLHYTNQPKFWAWLFDLATEFDVQIFATTHSREMIEAYVQTTIEKGMEEEAIYYELYRSPTTNQIKNHRIAVDTIPFKFERNKPIRGERT